MRIRLKEFRKRLGISLETMAERTGVSESQLSRWEAGASNIPSERLPLLAKGYECRVGDIFDDSDSGFLPIGPTLYVKGEVAAGQWREAVERPPDEWTVFTGRADIATPLLDRGGMRVVGESMNLLYPHGTIVEYVKLIAAPQLLESGKRVIVQRERADGTYEVTVKEYVVDDAERQWLVPRSTHPEFQTPWRVDQPEDGIIGTEILGVVVASVRPE
jgi:transcriptional regulator with XRE-family HTH domain